MKPVITFLKNYIKLLSNKDFDSNLRYISDLEDIVNYVEKSELQNSDEYLFDYLFSLYDFSTLPQVFIHFRFVNLQVKNGFSFFGRNSTYNFNYVRDLKTNEILIIDDSNDILFKIAKNEKNFFNVLNCLFEYQILDGSGSVIDLRINYIKEKAIEFAGGKTYKEYYDLIF